MSYHSQFGQDKYVFEQVLDKKENGIFVDIGASDPIHQNNTIFFENIGWHGIVIEPIKQDFENLKKTRSCICENVAVSNKDEIRKFIEVTGYAKGLSGLLESYDFRHLVRLVTELQHHGGTANIVDVSCVSLNSLLKKHNFFNVDYMSLDIEGKELDVLQDIDFDTIKIKCLSVENNYNKNDINEFLSSKGYKRLTKLVIDEIYYKP